MTVVYLIGPSRVGKSSAGRRLAKAGRATHVDLDDELVRADPRRPRIAVTQDWGLVVGVLEEIESRRSGPPIVVSIGAGTQDMDRQRGEPLLEEWLRTRTWRVIAIQGDREELFRRNTVHEDRDVHDRLEYGPKRLRLYRLAGSTVDISGLDEEDAALKVGAAVDAIGSPACRGPAH
jgi:shikimate kinase